MLGAKPAHIKRKRIVVVMGMGAGCTTLLTGLTLDTSARNRAAGLQPDALARPVFLVLVALWRPFLL